MRSVKVLILPFLAYGTSCVRLAPSISTFACTPTTVGAGSASACTVTLTSAAGTAGFPVQITTTGTGITAPASVTIGWTNNRSTFQVSAATTAPAQTATVAARAGTVSKTASLSIVSASSITYTVTSLTCTPPALVPGQMTNCTGTISTPAPLAGLAGTVASNSANLPVPAVIKLVGNASSFTFSATAAATTPALETPVIAAAVSGGPAKAVSITIDPAQKFLFKGNTTEMPTRSDGAAVTASIQPAGWTGTLTERGTGSTVLDPVEGVSFHPGGNQGTNTAFVNFSSGSFGTTFNASSEIAFVLKSAYTFAERKAIAQPNMRNAFEIYDATISWASFNTYTTTSGQLQFGYGAIGYAGVYTVPAGTEDAVFGKNVAASIKITWSSSSFSLWLNGKSVQTNKISVPRAVNWTAASAFTIGARSVRVTGGGYYACDDVISQLSMR